MIRRNIIHNFTVTVEDIDIAEKIFGPDVYTLKGITTRHGPKLVVDDSIKITRELVKNIKELIICMDIMIINQQAFFIKEDIRFHGLVPLLNRRK